MAEKDKDFAIFFKDFTKEAQERIIDDELWEGLNLEPGQIKLLDIEIEDELYGYDEDPKKQRLLEYIHAKTNHGDWLLVWDAIEHFFDTTMKKNQKVDNSLN